MPPVRTPRTKCRVTPMPPKAPPKKKMKPPVLRYNPRRRCYMLGNTCLKGGQKWLREHLYPHFNYILAAKNGAANVSSSARSTSSPPRCANGLFRGAAVDRQISYWAKYKRIPSKRHRFTISLMDAFTAWKWEPVTSQWVVASPRLRLGTAIDLVMRDPSTGDIFLLEVKAGFHGSWTVAQGYLRRPLHAIPSCPLHHAYLQLALGYALLDPVLKAKVKTCYVIQVTAEGVHRFPVPEWAHTTITHLFGLSSPPAATITELPD